MSALSSISSGTTTGQQQPHHKESMFHGGVAKFGSFGQITTLRSKLSRWHREMNLRKQAFGVDVFDVMQRNRNVGERMGGVSDEPRIVEVFADAATDVEFLVNRRQQSQATLANLNIAARDMATKNAIAKKEMAVSQELSGTSILLASTPPSSSSGMTVLRLPWTFVSSMGSSTRIPLATVFPSRKADAIMRKKLMAEIDDFNNEIFQRKQLFGIEMFDAMMSLGEDFQSRDDRVCELFLQAKKDMEIPLKKSNDAMLTIEQSAKDAVRSISHEELREFVETHPVIWAMLSVNCQIPEQYCKEVAFRVAIELITEHTGQESMGLELTKQGFHRFEKLYINDAKGHQEFFHRTLFAAFDEDWNGVLDREETDKFLDTFYISGSIFQGDARLPEKNDLKAQILDHLDENGDARLTFDEVRSLISGRIPTSQ